MSDTRPIRIKRPIITGRDAVGRLFEVRTEQSVAEYVPRIVNWNLGVEWQIFRLNPSPRARIQTVCEKWWLVSAWEKCPRDDRWGDPGAGEGKGEKRGRNNLSRIG